MKGPSPQPASSVRRRSGARIRRADGTDGAVAAIMFHLSPAETVELSLAALPFSAPPAVATYRYAGG